MCARVPVFIPRAAICFCSVMCSSSVRCKGIQSRLVTVSCHWTLCFFPTVGLYPLSDVVLSVSLVHTFVLLIKYLCLFI